ncbi:MAG: hypothetical protein ACR2JM_11395 [Mycobacterium sp.]
MHPNGSQSPRRNLRGWIIAGICAALLIALLVLWGMRPGRQGQPGHPGQPAHHDGAATPTLIIDPTPAELPVAG